MNGRHPMKLQQQRRSQLINVKSPWEHPFFAAEWSKIMDTICHPKWTHQPTQGQDSAAQSECKTLDILVKHSMMCSGNQGTINVGHNHDCQQNKLMTYSQANSLWFPTLRVCGTPLMVSSFLCPGLECRVRWHFLDSLSISFVTNAFGPASSREFCFVVRLDIENQIPRK